MFWKLKYHTSSAIDGLLDKEDVTLAQILDEEDVLQECKTQNRKLIDFLLEPDNISKLVNFVTVEPAENDDEKIRFKYPHIACELLTSEISQITEKLANTKALIKQLWSFLDNENPLNPLIGSFTSKVLTMLLCKYPSVILEYAQQYENFVDRLLCHLATSAMMDLLLHMLVIPENEETQAVREQLAQWFNDQGIVEKLINYIYHAAEPEKCYNASQVLSEMLKLSWELVKASTPAPLLQTLTSESTVQLLLKNMFDVDIISDSVIISGISYLLMLVDVKRVKNSLCYGGYDSVACSTSDEPVHEDVETTCRRTLAILPQRLKHFHDLLLRKPNMSAQRTTVGVLEHPLGNARLQTLELITALIEAGDSAVNAELTRLNILTVLLDLFFKYPWNNFLHGQVETCILALLSSNCAPQLVTNGEPAEQDSPFDAHQSQGTSSPPASAASLLVANLFNECHLIERLMDGYNRNEEIEQNGGYRQGYMGHLMRIGTAVYKHSQEKSHILTFLENSVDEDTCTKWSDFLKGPLSDHIARNETNLGGMQPMASSMEDSDDDGEMGYGQDNDAEKAFSAYQCMKLVNSFIDDFGHPDELQTMEEPISAPFDRLDDISFEIPAHFENTELVGMFESACAERLQPFDDQLPPEDEFEDEEWTTREFTFADISLGNQDEISAGRVSDEVLSSSSSDDNIEQGGPSIIREYQTAASPTTGNDDDNDDVAMKSVRNPVASGDSQYYSPASDTDTTSLLNPAPNYFGQSHWSDDNMVVHTGTAQEASSLATAVFTDWTKEPEETEEVGWAHFGDNTTRQSIVQEKEVPSSYLPEVAQSPRDDDRNDTGPGANYGYSPLQFEDEQVHQSFPVTTISSANRLGYNEVPVDVPGATTSASEIVLSDSQPSEHQTSNNSNTTVGDPEQRLPPSDDNLRSSKTDKDLEDEEVNSPTQHANDTTPDVTTEHTSTVITVKLNHSRSADNKDNTHNGQSADTGELSSECDEKPIVSPSSAAHDREGSEDEDDTNLNAQNLESSTSDISDKQPIKFLPAASHGREGSDNEDDTAEDTTGAQSVESSTNKESDKQATNFLTPTVHDHPEVSGDIGEGHHREGSDDEDDITKKQEGMSDQHSEGASSTHPPLSNSVNADDKEKMLNSNDLNKEAVESHKLQPYPQSPVDNAVADEEDDLEANFGFLHGGLMSTKVANNQQSAVEQARANALKALNQYDQETQEDETSPN